MPGDLRPRPRAHWRRFYDSSTTARFDTRTRATDVLPDPSQLVLVSANQVGEIGLGYDQSRDLAAIIVRELLTEEQDPESAAIVRYWCNRSQLRALSRWGAEIVSRGRPLCPQCGQPMEPEGHFCPKKNGHKH